MSKGKLVPFGKYKGRPVEELAADTDYLEWLRTQPWFKEKFGFIERQIVVVKHGLQKSMPTPEHNALQARFLDHNFASAFGTLVVPGLADGSQIKINIRATADEIERRLESALSMRHNKSPSRVSYLRSALEAIRALDLADIEFYCKVEFESGGVDVMAHYSASWVYPGADERPMPGVDPIPRVDWEYPIPAKVELKTSLGDDYPAVLRQMNANGSRILVASQFRSKAIDERQLRKFFASSNKRVVMVAEIEAACRSLPEWLRDRDEESA